MKRQALFLILLLSIFMGYSQTKTVNMPKAGKLKSLIDKDEYSKISKLKIIGDVNDKDYKFIKKLPNVTSIDLKEAKGTLTECPYMPNLKELNLSKDIIIQNSFMEGLTKCINIQTLSITKKHINTNNLDYYKALTNLKKIILPYSSSGSYYSLPTIKIDTLVIADSLHFEHYQANYFDYIYPNVVVGGKNVTILNNLTDENLNFKGINILPYSSFFYKLPAFQNIKELVIDNEKIRISFGYYNNSNIISLSTDESDDVITIDKETFSECEKLTNITFNRPVIINPNAFVDCKSLSKIHFKKGAIIKDYAFKNCNVDSLIFDNSDVYLGNNIFETLKYVFFNNPPKSVGRFVINKKSYYEPGLLNKTVAIMKKEYAQIVKDKNPDIDIFDPYYCNLSYDIRIEQPGTILSYIPIDSLERVQNLKINGILYETDIQILNKCINLKYLDLSNAIVVDSPEKQARNLANNQTLTALFSILGNVADMNYQNGKMKPLDYIMTKGGINAIISSNKNAEELSGICKLPSRSFMYLYFLEEVKLPKLLSRIYEYSFRGCINLKKVTFPDNLKAIYHDAFYGCEKLTNISFPKSLNYMGGYQLDYGFKSAFGLCPLKVIDLSDCVFKEWFRSFSETEYEIIYLPELTQEKEISLGNKTKKAYLPYSVKKFYIYSDSIEELHFKNPIPPEFGGKVKNGCIIYCPKGTTTAYYNIFGKSCKYIEE